MIINVYNDIAQEDLDYIVKLHKLDKMHEELYILGDGASGVVFGYKDYAIKSLFDSNDSNDSNDIEALIDLSHLDFIPKIYATINNEVIIVEKIEGITVKHYCNTDLNNSLNIDEDFMEIINEYVIEIVANGYIPKDMHGDNIMICEYTGRPIIVDLGWFIKHDNDMDDINIDSLSGESDAYDLVIDEIYGYIRNIERRKRIKNYV